MSEPDTIRVSYEKICAGEDVRQTLIALKNTIRENDAAREELTALLGGDFTPLCDLLHAEDPKIRKNAALVLGMMKSEELLPILFHAYEEEETLYVRADYLKAISNLDYRPLSKELSQHLEELRSAGQYPPEEWKHVSEEIRILQEMVLHCSGMRRHRFTAGKDRESVILLTNRRYRKATAEQIRRGKITMLAGGIRMEDASLKEVLPIRTYTELLFPLDTEQLSVQDPKETGKALAYPTLRLLDRISRGDGVFPFRLELRGRAEQQDLPFTEDTKGVYLRRIAQAVEAASGARLVNSVKEYEIEIRLVLRKDGTFAAMLKPSRDFDGRFTYCRETVASSIAPANAALTAYLTREWQKEDAQVLDPFCGVGTMLIERSRRTKAGSMYGVDLFGEAIEKARRNTERADCRINYVNRDFFTFRHAYQFDEVITDMPSVTGEGTKRELRQLYHHFFKALPPLFAGEAVLILYTPDPNYVVESVRESGHFRIEKSFLMNEKNGTTVFVVSYKSF